MEEIELPVEKVDIIISEWMGYCLFYEAMFDSVIYARDKYLVKGGKMFPDRATMMIASIEDEDYKDEKIGFWDNVYGVSMSCIKKWAMMEPLVDVIDKKTINSNSCPILDVDLEKVKIKDLDFASGFKLSINKNDYVHALVTWFDVYFSHGNKPIILSTSPYSKSTHWKQIIFYL